MANILLTSACNLSCKYCFARERMLTKRRQQMSMEDVCKVIRFLKKSEFPLFRAMGGEPALHPRFPEIVELALREGMRVDVLSNATWGDHCIELFDRIPPSRINFLLNIDHPDNYRPKQWARIEQNLASLPERRNVTLSFNIFERRPRCDYIFDLTRRYGFRSIRMSFSLPVYGGGNTYLELDETRELAPFVMKFVEQAEGEGVDVRLDNVVPLCIFSEEQAGRLMLAGALDLNRNSRCEPIVDIGPDLSVWCCFCLSPLYNRRLDEFECLQEIDDFYRGILRHYQSELVPWEECRECKLRERWSCQGGCITYSLIKHPERVAVKPPESARPGLDSEAFLRVAGGVVVKRYDLPRDCFVLSQEPGGLELELEGARFAPLESLLDGSRTAGEIRELCAGGNGGPEGSPLDAFVDRIETEGYEALLAGMLEHGFLEQSPSPGPRAPERAR